MCKAKHHLNTDTTLIFRDVKMPQLNPTNNDLLQN